MLKTCKCLNQLQSVVNSLETVPAAFDPDNWPIVMPTKSEDEVHQAEIKLKVEENRADGHAPIKSALSVLLQGLQNASARSTSLSDMDVTLFNFHSTCFAERLLNRNVKSCVIVESSHSFSKSAKQFAAKYDNVDAYRADIASLMGLGRKKTLKLPKKLLFAGKPAKWSGQVGPFELNDDGMAKRAPNLLTVLPTPTAQKAIMESMMAHALLHFAKMDDDTIFAYGEANLFTFLHCGVFAQYMCSNDHGLKFLSHQHRRHSSVFKKLFDLSLLSTRLKKGPDGPTRVPMGYPCSSFHPPIPVSSKLTHEKKLAEVGLFNGLQYAVRLKPHRRIEIAGREMGTDLAPEELLMPFAHFMTVIGRQPAAKLTENVFRELFPETTVDWKRDELGEKIGIVADEALEEMFLMVAEELKQSNTYLAFRNELRIKRAA